MGDLASPLLRTTCIVRRALVTQVTERLDVEKVAADISSSSTTGLSASS